MRPARITGGSQDESEHPRLTEFVTLASAEAERSVFDSAWEAIQNHRIALAVDDVFNFTDQVSQPRRRKPALENRELYSLTVLSADLSDALEPRRPTPLGIGDVVCDEDVHRFKAVRTEGTPADHRADGGRVASPGPTVVPNGRSVGRKADDGSRLPCALPMP